MGSKTLFAVAVTVGLLLAGANAAVAIGPNPNANNNPNPSAFVNRDVRALPEPGAAAVFGVGLLVSGLLIRRLRKP